MAISRSKLFECVGKTYTVTAADTEQKLAASGRWARESGEPFGPGYFAKSR
jgi:hypothetical protein